jgi:hypothetical protein
VQRRAPGLLHLLLHLLARHNSFEMAIQIAALDLTRSKSSMLGEATANTCLPGKCGHVQRR